MIVHPIHKYSTNMYMYQNVYNDTLNMGKVIGGEGRYLGES